MCSRKQTQSRPARIGPFGYAHFPTPVGGRCVASWSPKWREGASSRRGGAVDSPFGSRALYIDDTNNASNDEANNAPAAVPCPAHVGGPSAFSMWHSQRRVAVPLRLSSQTLSVVAPTARNFPSARPSRPSPSPSSRVSVSSSPLRSGPPPAANRTDDVVAER